MTTADINRAIAEACGYQQGHWIECHATPSCYGGMILSGRTWSNLKATSPNGEILPELPNFAASLDAMAEARKTLNHDELVRYGEELDKIMGHPRRLPLEHVIDAACATAAQHAEAFCKAKGIWKD